MFFLKCPINVRYVSEMSEIKPPPVKSTHAQDNNSVLREKNIASLLKKPNQIWKYYTLLQDLH